MRKTAAGQGRILFIICATSGLWAFSFGLGAPLASLWLKRAGCSDTIIGLNTAIYYAGLAIAALGVPSLMRRYGPNCSTFGMAVAGLSVALFPFINAPLWWFILRLIGGMAGALSLIPMETYVNRDLAPEHRGRNFGLYAVALTLGWALGNCVGLAMIAETPRTAFLIGGAAGLIAAIVVNAHLPSIKPRRDANPRPTSVDVRENYLSFGSAWCQGFLEGGMIAFLSLYIIGRGLSEQDAGWLTSATMVGIIVFQVPVSWLGDLFGRLPVLLVCYGLVAIGLAVLPFAGTTALLAIALFLVGACSGAFYPLGLAMLGENLPTNELDRANAWYLSVECVGCLMGPAIMGIARDWGGENAMFVVGEAALLVVLGSWLVWRRPDAPEAIPVEGDKSNPVAA